MAIISEREDKVINDLMDEANRLMADWPPTRNRQKKFVLAYIEGGFNNAAEAARNAGYSERSAKEQAGRMLTDVNFKHIQSVIEKYKVIYNEKLLELSILTPIELQQFWTRIILGKEKDTQMIGIGEGVQELIEVPPSIRDRLKSSELLGKTHGVFIDKQELTASIQSVGKLDSILTQLSDDGDG